MKLYVDPEKALLKQWQLIAVGFLADEGASPSMLESAYIALRRDAPMLAKKCKEEAKSRIKQKKNTE